MAYVPGGRASEYPEIETIEPEAPGRPERGDRRPELLAYIVQVWRAGLAGAKCDRRTFWSGSRRGLRRSSSAPIPTGIGPDSVCGAWSRCPAIEAGPQSE